MRRSLLILGAAALLTRWSTALLTEKLPIFPAYAYADALLYDKDARTFAGEMRAGRPVPYRLTPNREIYTNWVVLFYYWLGPCPLVLKLINGALAAASVCLWFLAFRAVGPPPVAGSERAAFAAALLIALWPTHVFYTSQNTKEAWALLALAAAFYLALGDDGPSCDLPRPLACDLRPLGGAAALFFAGLLRDHLIPAAGAALLLGALWGAIQRRRRPWALGRSLWTCACVAAAVVAFRPASGWIFERYGLSFAPRDRVPFVKGYIPPKDGVQAARDWTPQWLTQSRRARQQSDQSYAQAEFGRRVKSQLFTDVELRTWADVLAFLPKGAFTVLFMPLPGLYPLEGNPGRIAASAENVLVLAVCLLAFAGAARLFADAGRAPLAAFFLAVWAASALLEVDLGSATRHRIVYLPFLLPFAAWEGLRLMENRRPGSAPGTRPTP